MMVPGRFSSPWTQANVSTQVCSRQPPRPAPRPYPLPTLAGDMQAGTHLSLYDCNGYPQQALGYDADKGLIYLANSRKDASICLDTFSPAVAGNPVQLWGCNGLSQQQLNILWGTTIRTTGSSYSACLDLRGGDPTAGTPVELWACNGGVHQQWVYDPSSGALIWGGNGASPAVCVDSHDFTSGSTLFIWECNGLGAQQWGFDASMKSLYLRASEADASACMDLRGGSLDDGATVQVWGCNGCWNQQWLLGGGVELVSPPQSLGGSWPTRRSNRTRRAYQCPEKTSTSA